MSTPKKKKQPVKYVSIKLPASAVGYPCDEMGCRKLPEYTPDYLKRHGRKLFKILFNSVPSTVYGELIKCIREQEKF